MIRHLIRGLSLGAIFALLLASHYAQAGMLNKPAPGISAGPWINSRPLTPDDLKGRVVLVEFWTYG